MDPSCLSSLPAYNYIWMERKCFSFLGGFMLDTEVISQPFPLISALQCAAGLSLLQCIVPGAGLQPPTPPWCYLSSDAISSFFRIDFKHNLLCFIYLFDAQCSGLSLCLAFHRIVLDGGPQPTPPCCSLSATPQDMSNFGPSPYFGQI